MDQRPALIMDSSKFHEYHGDPQRYMPKRLVLPCQAQYYIPRPLSFPSAALPTHASKGPYSPSCPSSFSFGPQHDPSSGQLVPSPFAFTFHAPLPMTSTSGMSADKYNPHSRMTAPAEAERRLLEESRKTNKRICRQLQTLSHRRTDLPLTSTKHLTETGRAVWSLQGKLQLQERLCREIVLERNQNLDEHKRRRLASSATKTTASSVPQAKTVEAGASTLSASVTRTPHKAVTAKDSPLSERWTMSNGSREGLPQVTTKGDEKVAVGGDADLPDKCSVGIVTKSTPLRTVSSNSHGSATPRSSCRARRTIQTETSKTSSKPSFLTNCLVAIGLGGKDVIDLTLEEDDDVTGVHGKFAVMDLGGPDLSDELPPEQTALEEDGFYMYDD